MQASELFAVGRSQAEVARKLGVARQNVRCWHAPWRFSAFGLLACCPLAFNRNTRPHDPWPGRFLLAW